MVPGSDQITGIVLAGGRGSRMGGADKGWVQWRGRPLIETVLERLRPQTDTIIVSANRHHDRYEVLGVSVVADSVEVEPFSGPLVGIRSALSQVATPWALIVPCDAPLLPQDLASRLAEGLGNARAAVAWVGGRVEPLYCLLATNLWLTLDRAIADGERSPRCWLESIATTQVPMPEAAAFANINTLQQLEAP